MLRVTVVNSSFTYYRDGFLFGLMLSWGLEGEHLRAGRAPGIFCDLCPTGGLLRLICWATLYGFAPWPPGHQQMF